MHVKVEDSVSINAELINEKSCFIWLYFNSSIFVRHEIVLNQLTRRQARHLVGQIFDSHWFRVMVREIGTVRLIGRNPRSILTLIRVAISL